MDNSDKKLNSYVTKDEFIKILEIIDFIAIEDAELNLITGLLYKDDRDVLLTKNIRIS